MQPNVTSLAILCYLEIHIDQDAESFSAKTAERFEIEVVAGGTSCTSFSGANDFAQGLDEPSGFGQQYPDLGTKFSAPYGGKGIAIFVAENVNGVHSCKDGKKSAHDHLVANTTLFWCRVFKVRSSEICSPLSG